ncbi:MAG: transglycosylase SLT domain-containing protein [Gallionella sp.]|nr:transglycosylase SLT domain-containing protein [Gallionella sp.]MDP1941814.1 transglycosylase SLT domain-containing protein [Gallionella sp.]
MKFLLLLLSLIVGTALAGQDDDFLAARDAFRAGDAAKLAILAQRLQHSPLEVYISYYQLRMKLETVDVGVIRAYLARPDDTPLIDKMRAEWLKTLGKKQQWTLFDSEYPRLLADNAELTCYALQSRLRSQQQAVLREARDLWFSGKDMPEGCGTVFEAALTAGVITQQDIWQRLRLALEAGNASLAKYLAGQLVGEREISPDALSRAMENPGRYLERESLDNASAGQRAVALFALQRLAKQSPDLAARHWEKLAVHFPESEQHYFFGWLAYEGARKHDARAPQWFREAGRISLNEQQSAWRVRAALRAQDWPEVLSAINGMSAEQRGETAWRYWQARALQALGRRAEATKIFVPLSVEYDFYGQMAGDELADTPMLSAQQTIYQPSKNDVAAIAALPGVQRALALYRMDLRTDAMREWIWVIRNFNDQELLAAAEIARRNEMYDRAINTAEKTVRVHDFGLRYLAPYRAALREHIQENSLEEAWVYGLMRQESRFVTSAKSGVGAAGLMQVMPATARWIAKKLGLKDYRESLIHQLDTNLRLGTFYMKNMLSSLDDSPVLASAAYNAGPGRARRWRAETPMEGAIYAESIPFNETRDYVKKVMSNTVYYARQFGDPPRSLKQRVGIITGKPGDSTLADDKSPGATQ